MSPVMLGRVLLNQFPPFRYFHNFSASPKYMLAIEYHVLIWRVSPQFSCNDTCQIWIWCKIYNRYFGRIETFAYVEIQEQSFSNPHRSMVAHRYFVVHLPLFVWAWVMRIRTLFGVVYALIPTPSNLLLTQYSRYYTLSIHPERSPPLPEWTFYVWHSAFKLELNPECYIEMHVLY